MINQIIQYLFRKPASLYRSGLRLFCIVLLGSSFMACTQERQPCLTPKIASFNLRFVHFTADSSIALNSFADTGLPSAIFTAITDSGNRSVIYTAPSAYFTISLAIDSRKFISYLLRANKRTASMFVMLSISLPTSVVYFSDSSSDNT